jgi:hypothetical protein
MKSIDIINQITLEEKECAFVYKYIILLFERANPDDDAFNLADQRIIKYCSKHDIKIYPKENIDEVNRFCRDDEASLDQHIGGFVVFPHNSRNQLRQLVHHMRNACAHADISIFKKKNEEYLQFRATEPRNNNRIKLLARIRRNEFPDFWTTLINTLNFKE